MIWNILTTLFASWAAEVGALTWLGLVRLRGTQGRTAESLRGFHDRILRFGAAPLALFFR